MKNPWITLSLSLVIMASVLIGCSSNRTHDPNDNSNFILPARSLTFVEGKHDVKVSAGQQVFFEKARKSMRQHLETYHFGTMGYGKWYLDYLKGTDAYKTSKDLRVEYRFTDLDEGNATLHAIAKFFSFLPDSLGQGTVAIEVTYYDKADKTNTPLAHGEFQERIEKDLLASAIFNTFDLALRSVAAETTNFTNDRFFWYNDPKARAEFRRKMISQAQAAENQYKSNAQKAEASSSEEKDELWETHMTVKSPDQAEPMTLTHKSCAVKGQNVGEKKDDSCKELDQSHTGNTWRGKTDCEDNTTTWEYTRTGDKVKGKGTSTSKKDGKTTTFSYEGSLVGKCDAASYREPFTPFGF